MQIVRLIAAFLLAAVVGGSIFVELMVASAGGDVRHLLTDGLAGMLISVLVVIAGVNVLPLVTFYAFANSPWRWGLFMALAWVPLAIFDTWIMRISATRPITESLDLVATVAAGTFIINLIFWSVAGYRREEEPGSAP
ncbi:MAG: hypothetical protein ACTHOP_23860 [Mesorhizobium sp.]